MDSKYRLIPQIAKNSKVSIVVPSYNEEGNIERTILGLLNEEKNNNYKFEIIAVNNSSKDNTWEIIDRLATKYSNVIGINLMDDFGQSQGYQSGIDNATGDYILICSADLETDFKYITQIIKLLDSGYDFVNTNRVGRWGKDRAVKSGYANRLIKVISGMNVSDRGSGMKGMIAPLAKSLRFYGDMHRFIPDYLSVYGARMIEIDTEFNDRDSGASYYKGHKRTIKVLLDLVTLVFMLYFSKKPHTLMPGRFFGATGAIMSFIGGSVSVFLILQKLFFNATLADRPLFTLGILTLFLGIIMIMFGMLGELIMRIYFESTGRKTYMIRSISRKSSK